MRPTKLFAAALASGLALAGCATNRPVADVTRFHIGAPPARASIAVVPNDPALAQSLQFRGDASAVEQRFAALGYVPAPPAAAEYLVTMAVQSGTRDGPPKPPPFSIGIGGATFGGNVGLGGGVTLPVGRSRQTLLRSTELFLQMKRRSDQSVVWEGRASATDDGQGYAVVPLLADAMLRDFPGPSGQTVRVTLPPQGRVAGR